MKQRFLVPCGALVIALLLAACGGMLVNGGTSTTTIQITETDFHINAPVTSFVSGTPYHFVVKNLGKTTHEFMIMPRSEGSMSGMPMGDMDKMALASISMLNPGETKTLDYTFPASAAGSHPELACYLSGHYEAGMKQSLVVKS